jgi:hypothetical protein
LEHEYGVTRRTVARALTSVWSEPRKKLPPWPRTVGEHFAIEQPLLKPMPDEPFDMQGRYYLLRWRGPRWRSALGHPVPGKIWTSAIWAALHPELPVTLSRRYRSRVPGGKLMVTLLPWDGSNV